MIGSTDTAKSIRWRQSFRRRDSLVDDLGSIGERVGPRTGPEKRTKGQKEDYVFRRVIVALAKVGAVRFPFQVVARADVERQPDFELGTLDGCTIGLEVTEAGEEQYQAWLTRTEDLRHKEIPLEASTDRTVDELERAIRNKVAAFAGGSYREPHDCHLAIYDNTAWGGFLNKYELVSELRTRITSDLGFSQVHLVFGPAVVVDCFATNPEYVELQEGPLE